MMTNLLKDSQRTIHIGTREMVYPSDQLGELHDSTSIRDDPVKLAEQLRDRGYILIRQFFDRDKILAARKAILSYIRDCGEGKLDTAHALEDGVLNQRCGFGCLPMMEGRNAITHSDSVLSILESQSAFTFFKDLFGEPARTFDFKWLRAMHREGFTGAHVDRVYMGRGSQRVLTMWTPFGDTPIEMGTLAVCEASHRLPGFDRFQQTYGNLDVEAADLNGSGWFTSDPSEILNKFGGKWKTTDFNAGDVLIFTMRTVHMATNNKTHFARLSCDTRWQPACDAADQRYVGDIGSVQEKFGVAGDANEKLKEGITMEHLKEKWRLS